MADEIDEIRARIDIVDLIGQRVNLRRTGKNFLGLCPFHDDKRPSFNVDPSAQRYRCWSCQEHGDAFTWVQKTQNLDFREALELLAKQAGVTLTRNPSDAKKKSERAQHLEIMESALAFFKDQLAKSTVALDYLKGRGIEDQTVAEWELGYAPDVGEALAVHLQKKGYSLAVCRSLFLVEEDSSGGYYDKFRGRLMFPIRDERGALVAFGGRILGDGIPKYINSSDTDLYKKSMVLYGLNRAANSLSKMKPRRAVLCEGYLDVIACHRSGVTGAVASLGTALSDNHAKLLKRWSDEVVILYDADSAGQKAAEGALEKCKIEGLPARVALMPPGDDPDTLLRRSGPSAVAESVEKSVTPTEFRLGRVVAAHPEKDSQFWTEVVGVLAQADDVTEIQKHIQRVVGEFAGVNDPAFVMRQLQSEVMKLRKAGPRTASSPTASPIKISLGKLTASEACIIAALVVPGLRTIAHEALIEPELLESDPGRKFSAAYSELFISGAPTGEAVAWINSMDEKCMEMIERCSADQRFAQLNDKYVKDSIEALKKKLIRRKYELVKNGQEDPDRLSKITEILERLKKKGL